MGRDSIAAEVIYDYVAEKPRERILVDADRLEDLIARAIRAAEAAAAAEAREPLERDDDMIRGLSTGDEIELHPVGTRNRIATLESEKATLENRLRIAESDSDENYTQGIRRGGLTAMNTINALPLSDDHSRGDRVTQCFVRADCIEAIHEAIQETTDGVGEGGNQ
jgi:BMFP domain-containing protein YqiC